MRPETDPLSAEELRKMHAYWRAANYLSVGQIYLLRQPAAEGAARARARQAAPARPLGDHAGAEPPLRPPEPGHQEARPGHDLRHRSGARRPGAGRQRVPRRHLQRGLPGHRPGRGRDEEAVQAVQLPRRDPEPRRARDARLDPRGRRARLRAVARVRRRVRQPGSDRRLRRRRRRGRDRPARDGLALEQVPEPGTRRRGAADPASERLQDRQSVLPRAHPAGRAAEPLRGLRLRAALRRRRRAGEGPSAAGRRARRGRRRHQADPARRADEGRHEAAGLADDRAPHAEGLDLPEGDRRQEVRGLLARPSGADGRHGQAGARAHPRGVDEELQAGGAVRRGRPARARSSPSSRRAATAG